MSLEKGVEQEVGAEVLVTGPDNGSQQHIGPAIWLLLTAVTSWLLFLSLVLFLLSL